MITYKADFALGDVYKYYKKNKKGKLSRKDFIIIWKEYVDWLIEEQVLRGKVGYIPYNGNLYVAGKKKKLKLNENGEVETKSMSVDWAKTKQLWKMDDEAKENKTLIYHLNLHTNGRFFEYKWDLKKGQRFKNMSSYALRLLRQQKRKLPKKIFEGEVFI